MRDKRVGLKPKDRALAKPSPNKKLTGNQWNNTIQQNAMMAFYLDITSDSFGNSYASAVKAGYKPSYAVKISAPTTTNKWIGEYRKRSTFDINHIQQLLQALANDPKHFNNSRSPADSRIKAIEVLAKVLGLTDSKQSVTNVIVSPILGGNSVKVDSTIIDQ